jgi:hypothetical protein
MTPDCPELCASFSRNWATGYCTITEDEVGEFGLTLNLAS